MVALASRHPKRPSASRARITFQAPLTGHARKTPCVPELGAHSCVDDGVMVETTTNAAASKQFARLNPLTTLLRASLAQGAVKGRDNLARSACARYALVMHRIAIAACGGALALLALPAAGRDHGQDDALNGAIAVSAHIQFMFKRLSLCAELDTRNSPTYVLISGEYLRDAAIGDAITKTEHLIDAEIRALAGNSEGVEKAKAVRKQQTEVVYQKRRQEALAAPTQFQQDCRQLAQYFMVRQGPFRPLRTIYPKEIRDMDIWYVWESTNQCFSGGSCK